MTPSAVGNRMGQEFIGLVEDVGVDVRTVKRGDLVVAPFAWSDGSCEFCREGVRHRVCMRLVLEGRIQPGRVFDRVTAIDGVPDGYRAMNARPSIKVMIEF